jgi:hypothetical protein
LQQGLLGLWYAMPADDGDAEDEVTDGFCMDSSNDEHE